MTLRRATALCAYRWPAAQWRPAVGVTEAMNLCLRAVAKPGDVIAIESPTFFNILQIIESLGMRVCEIPTYPRHGICLDELERRLKCCRIKACVFTLNYSNPLGSCM